MRCERCQGLMVQDQCMDLLGTGEDLSIWTRRCVSCGNIVDPVILQHRRTKQVPIRAREMTVQLSTVIHETPTAA